MLVTLLTGCLGPEAIAVDNRTDQDLLLRFEGQWVWDVPAGSTGVGPSDIGFGERQVELLWPDCRIFAAWGLYGSRTITIVDMQAEEPMLSDGVEVSGQLETTDSCALREAGRPPGGNFAVP
jgi:hypothetical protein